MTKNKGEWGEGLDYLFKDIWANLDQIREDNLKYVHDDENIEHCFSVMYKVLSHDALDEVRGTDWKPQDKVEVLEKIAKALEHFKEAKTMNEKVIAINIAEQLLRAIY